MDPPLAVGSSCAARRWGASGRFVRVRGSSVTLPGRGQVGGRGWDGLAGPGQGTHIRKPAPHKCGVNAAPSAVWAPYRSTHCESSPMAHQRLMSPLPICWSEGSHYLSYSDSNCTGYRCDYDQHVICVCYTVGSACLCALRVHRLLARTHSHTYITAHRQMYRAPHSVDQSSLQCARAQPR